MALLTLIYTKKSADNVLAMGFNNHFTIALVEDYIIPLKR